MGLAAQIRKLWTIFWCQALKAQNSQLSVAVSFAQIGPLGAEKSHFSYFRIFKIIQICDGTTLPKFSRKFLIKKTCNALWEGSDQLKSGSSDAHAQCRFPLTPSGGCPDYNDRQFPIPRFRPIRGRLS